ncbi:MAG TPA: site-2 protease family protein [Anaerolineae bacterium]|nr:site-2 protease family protein [Anaerolineae bacterium]
MIVLEFVIALGTIIFLHELGHFVVGRSLNIEIEEFGFGYPPRLAKLFTWKGTDITINLIPFGAFVRFKGEDDPKVTGSLASANKWARLAILMGGPVMNLLIGILLFSIVFSSMGLPVADIVEIQEVVTTAPADTAGILAGDIIQAIYGEKIDSMEEVGTIIYQHLGEEIPLVVKRGNQTTTIQVTPRTEWPEEQGPIGIVMTNPIEPISFFQAVPLASNMAIEQGKQLFVMPLMLLRGEIQPSQARVLSPKGVYDIYAHVRQEEQAIASDTKTTLINTAWFFGIISIALGFSNLLPIPALDGGRILFLLPEIFLNKRVPAKFESVVHLIGFSTLIILMFYVFMQDFINPVVLP